MPRFNARVYLLSCAVVLTAVPMASQYPGQYPPGAGGAGIPIPRRSKKKEQQAELVSTAGMLRRMRKTEVVLEADDHRILNFKRTDSTKFLKLGNDIKPADLKLGDAIEVESTQDDEGFMTAVNVMWQQDGTAKDRAHAMEPVETSLAKGSHGKDKDKEGEGDADGDASAVTPVGADGAKAGTTPAARAERSGAQAGRAECCGFKCAIAGEGESGANRRRRRGSAGFEAWGKGSAQGYGSASARCSGSGGGGGSTFGAQRDFRGRG